MTLSEGKNNMCCEFAKQKAYVNGEEKVFCNYHAPKNSIPLSEEDMHIDLICMYRISENESDNNAMHGTADAARDL